MSYRLFYISQDITTERQPVDSWSVYREEYRDSEDSDPIDGSQAWVASYPDETAASDAARRMQSGDETDV